jgi:5'-3' exoribonuclease 1
MISDSTLLPEIDALYLDMNGIIHACTHPNDDDMTKSLTFREMILAIFGYIDRIVSEIVKPKKILFMAIDGCAPRAKLNQQRSRRFRSAQERMISMEKAKQKGEVIDEENMFDSNCITPGTEFMEKVGRHIRWFIRKKMKEDELWRNLEITFSGHDVPGEGEHKIMQYIREERAKPGYAPNLRHCMYGQDADLIMLGLATHEPHFTLLREVVNFNQGGRGKSSRQTVIRQTKGAQFQLLHLSILREYLELDFGIGIDHAVDRERLVDDFIFMTFLVGNDFLPHLPTLDIGEHAFDVIFGAYKQLLAKTPGYLVENGEICNFGRFEELCAIIGAQETEILRDREENERSMNAKRRKFKDNDIPTEEEIEEAEAAMQDAYEAAIRLAKGLPPDADLGALGIGESKLSEAAELFDDGDDSDDSDSDSSDDGSRQGAPSGNVTSDAETTVPGLDAEPYVDTGDDAEFKTVHRGRNQKTSGSYIHTYLHTYLVHICMCACMIHAYSHEYTETHI